jgi:hypothetical protein
MRSGTFMGKVGKQGDTGNPGIGGDYTKCTKCDEKISLDIHRRYDVLQNIYIDGENGQIRRPFVRFGYNSLGDMIAASDSIKTNNLKQGYVVSGSVLKNPIDFTLIANLPPIKDKISDPVYVWRPIAPDGYVVMGDIITSTNVKPPKTSLVCIPSDCAKVINTGEGYVSYRFLYQNMRPGKENDYIFISFWDTPINTFFTNYPDFGINGKQTFHNNTLLYNIVNQNEHYIIYDTTKQKHIPVTQNVQKLQTLFKKVISPVNLTGKRQNLGKHGYFNIGDTKLTSLWDAIQHYFPGNFNYQVSINGEGDILGGRRLDNIQKKIIKYAQTWVVPNKPMYILHNKCLMKTRIDYEKREIILKIKSLYSDFHYLMKKYGFDVPQLTEYLSSHFMRLKKQMRHIPDFSQKIKDEDFDHFSINRLKYFYEELKNLNTAILALTNEVPKDRRQKYFRLIDALKEYDEAKMNFDVNLDNDDCTKDVNELNEIKKLFYNKWDSIKMLFIGDKDFKKKLKDRDFDGMSDSKIQKVTDLLTDISRNLKNYIKKHCK